ncbi:MAG: hypothetical protein JG782_664 [Anaerophaga sp.]|nr:hypothetical protein [Anaerophaga sp.]
MLFRYLPATFMIFSGAKLNNRQNNNILCKFEPGTDTFTVSNFSAFACVFLILEHLLTKTI